MNPKDNPNLMHGNLSMPIRGNRPKEQCLYMIFNTRSLVIISMLVNDLCSSWEVKGSFDDWKRQCRRSNQLPIELYPQALDHLPYVFPAGFIFQHSIHLSLSLVAFYTRCVISSLLLLLIQPFISYRIWYQR